MGEQHVDAMALLKVITPLIETSGWAFTDEGARWLVGAKALLAAAKPPEQPCEECNDHENIGIADGLYIDCPKCTGKKGV